MGRRAKFRIEHWKIIAIFLVVYDILVVNASYFAALWLRFDCRFSAIPQEYLYAWLYFAPVYTVLCVVAFFGLRLYQSLWRFASFSEFVRVCMASAVTTVAHVLLISILYRPMPVSYYFVGAGLQFALVLGIRFSYRLVLLIRNRHSAPEGPGQEDRIMLIGAGAAGQMILRDINGSKNMGQKVCCIIDDNPNKWNRFIDNVPIVGGRGDILVNVQKYRINKIFLAIPSASAEVRRDILNICEGSNCELKNLPGMYQFIQGKISADAMKDVAVEDLLGREPIRVNLEEVFNQLSGKVILVTGGGGSIGSELCRQIASHAPKRLIVFDVYENNAYEIEQELRDQYPALDLVVLIGSVRDSRRINQVFETYKPELVYHAAAHKHVPLMETSPCEAIKNNAIGTYKTAYAAMMNGCRRFVLISTDKAVNPTNIMGASKRLCEMVVQTFDRMIREGRAEQLPALYVHACDEVGDMEKLRARVAAAKTEFVAVRFGNVLGSNGSVIPLFKKQIKKGGPVTVTHPDIIRYFMTISEAVSLVLQAGTYAKGGEIFVLDMGEPVKIDTLARNLIKLSGFRPDVDIRISYTGLRPGEKLFEEKLMSEEGMKTTPNHLIHIGSPIPFDTDQFLQQLQQLMYASYENDGQVRQLVARMVPTYVLTDTQARELAGVR
ncbi:MAG: polysaccharide biosynthesis protein [Oscillospiraceae bacterium]|nr:polysaccharide biosynthesis protein [Oscillospiraceae bacterium]